MMRVRVRVRGWIWGFVLVGAVAVAQGQGERAPAASVGAELRGLAARAGVVFVGQVAKIEPKDGVVEITFTVEQPVLGVVGGSYVMREWAGQWTGGQQPFRVGQRAMFFLHAPAVAGSGGAGNEGVGLSSAVDGMMGVLPVVPMGAAGELLDVRWVATRVKRGVGNPVAGSGGVALADAIAAAKGWQTEGGPEPKSVRLPEGVLGAQGDSAQAQRPGQAPGMMPLKEGFHAQR